MRVEITAEDTGGRNSFAFAAKCDGQLCGRIRAHKLLRKVGGRVVFSVDRVDVDEGVRRKGVATKLYEAAAGEACRRRSRLASTERNPEAHSLDFWEKQVRKGRAIEIPIRGANRARYTQFVLAECPPPSLARLPCKPGRPCAKARKKRKQAR